MTMAKVCHDQAAGAWRLFVRLLSRDPLPQTLKGAAGAGVGCCLFPIASIAIWASILVVWFAAALVLGTYALLMTIGWGAATPFTRTRVQPAIEEVRA